MRKFTDFTIMSDVDGTLMMPDYTIPKRNIEALERFTQAGGHFGIATGRSRDWTGELIKRLPVNAPCVLYNGGGLYDYGKQEFIMEVFLPEKAKTYMAEISERFPKVGALVVSGSTYFKVSDEMGIAYNGNYVPETKWQDITGPWYKVLFGIADGVSEKFFDFIKSKNYDGVRFVATNPNLIEMLPVDSSKGFALEELIRRTGLLRENLVAVGDFNNDIEMLRLAGIGVAVSGAPDELLAVADIVVGSCEDGALADTVLYLEKTYPG